MAEEKKMKKHCYDEAKSALRRKKERNAKGSKEELELERFLMWVQGCILCKLATERRHNVKLEFRAEQVGGRIHDSIIVKHEKRVEFKAQVPADYFFNIMQTIAEMYEQINGYHTDFIVSTKNADGQITKATLIIFM